MIVPVPRRRPGAGRPAACRPVAGAGAWLVMTAVPPARRHAARRAPRGPRRTRVAHGGVVVGGRRLLAVPDVGEDRAGRAERPVDGRRAPAAAAAASSVTVHPGRCSSTPRSISSRTMPRSRSRTASAYRPSAASRSARETKVAAGRSGIVAVDRLGRRPRDRRPRGAAASRGQRHRHVGQRGAASAAAAGAASGAGSRPGRSTRAARPGGDDEQQEQHAAGSGSTVADRRRRLGPPAHERSPGAPAQRPVGRPVAVAAGERDVQPFGAHAGLQVQSRRRGRRARGRPRVFTRARMRRSISQPVPRPAVDRDELVSERADAGADPHRSATRRSSRAADRTRRAGRPGATEPARRPPDRPQRADPVDHQGRHGRAAQNRVQPRTRHGQANAPGQHGQAGERARCSDRAEPARPRGSSSRPAVSRWPSSSRAGRPGRRARPAAAMIIASSGDPTQSSDQ